jgi:hypothetical protein
MYLISLSFQQFYGPIRETTGDFLVSAWKFTEAYGYTLPIFTIIQHP